MRTTLTFIFALLWAQSVLAQDYFTNLREGDSRFIGKEEKARVNAMYEKHGKVNLQRKIRNLFQTKKYATCASEVVRKLSWLEMEKEGIASLAMAARDLEIIDDIVLDIILKRNKVQYKGSFPAMQTGNVKAEEIEEDYKKFRDRLKDGVCAEDAFGALASSMYKLGYDKNGKFKATNKVAFKKGFIDRDEFEMVESFRRAKVHYWKLTLRTYSRKVRSLRRQIERYDAEESPFVTKMNKKAKGSLRQFIFENYSYMQILMMGNVIEKMRKRLDSTDISIIIRYDEDEDEVIPLEPTERFRFVLKLLRKEMAQLNQTNLFDGRRAPYMAIIAAGYEIGIVPAIELEELASLEEIWNPKTTRLERIMSWAQMFGGVASVVIPGPFAFLPVLAVMVVDGLTQQPKPESDQDISLF